MRRAILTSLAVVALCTSSIAEEGLRFEGKIALGPVAGRIDDMAVDINRQRLFVAELGNNSASGVDLAAGRFLN
jgi:hypothetical protein